MTTLERSFTARQLPWIKLGAVIDDPSVDATEAARLGGIDFDVEFQRAGRWRAEYDEDGNPTGDGEWIEEPTRRAIVRSDTDEWFSYVSSSYQIVQYREAFEFMDAIDPNYVAAGSMSHGRQGFMLVQLPEHVHLDVEIDGERDPHDLYVVLQTSHDLSKGIKIAVMTLRHKCMNMLTLPTFMSNVPQSWSIRHVGDPHQKLRQAQNVLTNASAYAERFVGMATQLGSVRVSSDDLRHITRRVLPDRIKRDEQVEAIVDAFEHAETVGFHETGWGAINAVSEYFQWGRTSAARTIQSEFTSPLDGDAAKFINRTAHLVMQRA